MTIWSEEIFKIIDKKLKDVRDKELNFFRIDEFKRNIKRVNNFSETCSICHKEKEHITRIVEKIDTAINIPGKERKEYDRFISRLSRHMQKSHGFYPPYYFSYVYALLGFILGAIAGYILMKIVSYYKWEMFGIGISVGLIASYIIGYIKDKKVRNEKKLM